MGVICFDMDNTLIHSDKCHIEAYNKAFVKNGLKKLKDSKIKKALTGETHFQVIRKLFPNMNKKDVLEIKRLHDYYVRKETYKYAKKINGVEETLKKLKKNYDLCLVSNCTKGEITALLKGTGIDKKLFKSLVGSDEVKHGKPHPDEIIKTERILHENVNYVVGDSIHDIKVGKKMGVATIGVLTGNTSKSKMLKEKPDFILKSVKQMIKLMDNIKQ